MKSKLDIMTIFLTICIQRHSLYFKNNIKLEKDLRTVLL